MAEYPWGSMLPAKRIATIDNQIAVNDKKRADLAAELVLVDRAHQADVPLCDKVSQREAITCKFSSAADDQWQVRKSKTLARSLIAVLGCGDDKSYLLIGIQQLLLSGKFHQLFERITSRCVGRY